MGLVVVRDMRVSFDGSVDSAERLFASPVWPYDWLVDQLSCFPDNL